MNNLKKILLYTVGIIVLVLVALSGYFATNYMTRKIEADERSNLLLRAQTVAALIDIESLPALQGSSSDTGTREHIRLKTSLEKVHAINTDTRFVYILGQKNNTQFFYVDAEPVDSPDYSSPGEIYKDAQPTDIEYYAEGVPYTNGPYTDSWGSWFSAFAPIKDNNGTMLGELGMDIDSQKVLLRIAIVKQATIIIFTLLFLSVLVITLMLRDSSLKK